MCGSGMQWYEFALVRLPVNLQGTVQGTPCGVKTLQKNMELPRRSQDAPGRAYQCASAWNSGVKNHA